MFVTKLGIIPIPEPYATRMRHATIETVSYNDALEVIAWLNGQSVLSNLIDRAKPSLRSADPLPPIIPSKYIKLVCTDGSISSPESYLRRRFQFIDDFFSDFPQETSATIPFSSTVVAACIGDDTIDVPDDLMYLERLLDCLSFLNPKDPLYYFRFSTRGLSTNKILELYSLLTDDDKMGLIRARSIHQDPSLHCTLAPLAHILEMHVDVSHLEELFSDYPSYLAITFAQSSYSDEEASKAFNRLMLTANFAQSYEMCKLHKDDLITLYLAIHSTFHRVDEWSDVKRLLTMIGAKYKIFGNENDYIPMPYFVKVELREFAWTGHVIGKIAQMVGVDQSQVLRMVSGGNL